MPRVSSVLALTLAAVVSACAADASNAPDARPAGDAGSAASDAAVAPDVGARDASARGDASAPDASPADAASPDVGSPDAGTVDASALDAGPTDAASPVDGGTACMPLDLDVYVVRCPSGPAYARRWVDPSNPVACPPYVTLLGRSYPDVAAAIAGEGCDATCIYQASISVSFIDHCGHRNGYIVFAAPGCDDLYEFSSGLYPSVEAWQEATSCGG